MSEEEWRPVVGYEGYYEVSNLGRVRSLSRMIHSASGQKPYPMRGRIKKHTISQGYPLVRLSRDNVKRNWFVHRLVAYAFLGEPEPGQEVCHIDGTRDNPAVDNLYWGTRAENLADSLAHGSWNNQNVGKTHCKRGHEFTPENTKLSYRKRPGRTANKPERSCITCHREQSRARYYAAKAATSNAP